MSSRKQRASNDNVMAINVTNDSRGSQNKWNSARITEHPPSHDGLKHKNNTPYILMDERRYTELALNYTTYTDTRYRATEDEMRTKFYSQTGVKYRRHEYPKLW